MYTHKFERQEVLGLLKRNGSGDKDVLFTNKTALIKIAGMMKFGGTMLMVVGVLFTLTILGAVIGIPLFFFGRKVKRRSVENLDIIEVVYAEYVAGLQ